MLHTVKTWCFERLFSLTTRFSKNAHDPNVSCYYFCKNLTAFLNFDFFRIKSSVPIKEISLKTSIYRINPPIRRGFFKKKKAPKNPDPSYNQGLWPYRYFQPRGATRSRKMPIFETGRRICLPSSLDRNSCKVIF